MSLSCCPTHDLLTFTEKCAQSTDKQAGLKHITRALSKNLQIAASEYLSTGPLLLLAKGSPYTLYNLLKPHIPASTYGILDDAIMLARLYQKESGLEVLRFRLEHVATDSCRKFHTDNVYLRLLCTYHGLATQYVATDSSHKQDLTELGVPKIINPSLICQFNTGDIALLKGRAWPGQSGVVHRSPPVSHLPQVERSRLLLTLDEPTACGMSDEQNPTIIF